MAMEIKDEKSFSSKTHKALSHRESTQTHHRQASSNRWRKLRVCWCGGGMGSYYVGHQREKLDDVLSRDKRSTFYSSLRGTNFLFTSPHFLKAKCCSTRLPSTARDNSTACWRGNVWRKVQVVERLIYDTVMGATPITFGVEHTKETIKRCLKGFCWDCFLKSSFQGNKRRSGMLPGHARDRFRWKDLLWPGFKGDLSRVEEIELFWNYF